MILAVLVRRQQVRARAVDELSRVRGDDALADREVLLAVGRSLTDGEFTLDEIARSLGVPEPSLAGALQGVFGVVPAPPG